MKATIAVLSFILSSAAKHNVDSESLSSELQQLGLPKGNGEGGHPGGVTKGRTWWDVPGLSWQPPALPPSRPDPVRDGSHAVLRHLPSAPSVLGGSAGCFARVWPQRGRGQRVVFLSSLFWPRAEHAGGLCRSYEEKQSSLQDSLRACSLRRECGVGRFGDRFGGWVWG